MTSDAQNKTTKHDHTAFAIHGALAYASWGAHVEECMKCGMWRAPALGILDWRHGGLREFSNARRLRRPLLKVDNQNER